LRNIFDYIANTLLEPQTARRIKKQINENLSVLRQYPEGFALFEDEPWRSRGLRRLVIGNYIALYRILDDKGAVWVFTVINGRRDIEELLKQENFSDGKEV